MALKTPPFSFLSSAYLALHPQKSGSSAAAFPELRQYMTKCYSIAHDLSPSLQTASSALSVTGFLQRTLLSGPSVRHTLTTPTHTLTQLTSASDQRASPCCRATHTHGCLLARAPSPAPPPPNFPQPAVATGRWCRYFSTAQGCARPRAPRASAPSPVPVLPPPLHARHFTTAHGSRFRSVLGCPCLPLAPALPPLSLPLSLPLLPMYHITFFMMIPPPALQSRRPHGHLFLVHHTSFPPHFFSLLTMSVFSTQNLFFV
ncbi:hypothetical protein B0H14DRAFT_3456227 [Mycena olivaceomarginata]|nr:hypothetical protein B0H14DRAFT_3456227 [Mycena olivaceomarginata]